VPILDVITYLKILNLKRKHGNLKKEVESECLTVVKKKIESNFNFLYY